MPLISYRTWLMASSWGLAKELAVAWLFGSAACVIIRTHRLISPCLRVRAVKACNSNMTILTLPRSHQGNAELSKVSVRKPVFDSFNQNRKVPLGSNVRLDMNVQLRSETLEVLSRSWTSRRGVGVISQTLFGMLIGRLRWDYLHCNSNCSLGPAFTIPALSEFIVELTKDALHIDNKNFLSL